MLIGARTGAWSGGKRLPYDAEVEYLEGVAGAYINTGVRPGEDATVSFVFMMPSEWASYTSYWDLFGCNNGETNRFCFAKQQAQYAFWRIGDKSNIGLNNISTKYGVKIDEKIVVSNGTYSETSAALSANRTGTYSGTLADKEIYVFKANSPSNYAPTVDGLRFYEVKIWKSGTLVSDLIPVRVGSVGYLYDRVSGKLFGNEGTGNFVAGPDKAAWTNPYVTDGLVAMWDGEWNAGGGVHDAAATVWKDLVGNHDIVVSPTWTETEFDDSARSLRAFIDGEDLPRDAITIEFVVRCPNFANNSFIVDCCDHVTNGIGAFTSNLESPFGIRCSARKSSWTYSVTKKADENYMSFCSVQSDQNGSALYADGAFFHSFGGMGTPITIWCIGGNATSVYNNFRGYISAIRLYNRRLTPAEITANYAIDKQRFGLP